MTTTDPEFCACQINTNLTLSYHGHKICTEVALLIDENKALMTRADIMEEEVEKLQKEVSDLLILQEQDERWLGEAEAEIEDISERYNREIGRANRYRDALVRIRKEDETCKCVSAHPGGKWTREVEAVDCGCSLRMYDIADEALKNE